MPDIFTPEQLQALTEALKPIIEGIASKAAADHVTKRNKSFEEKFDSFTSKFQTPSVKEVVETDEEKLTIKSLSKKMEDNEKKFRQELKAEKEASSRKTMRANLEATLIKDGVPATQVKAVAAQLIHEDKMVDIDFNGNPVFKSNDETFDLEEGISSWLKNEGKVFIPEATAKGQTGARSVNRRLQQNPSNGFQNEEDRDVALDALVRNMR